MSLQQVSAAVRLEARPAQALQRARVHPADVRHRALRAVFQGAAPAAEHRLQVGVQLGVGAVRQELQVGPGRQIAPGAALDAVVNERGRALDRHPDEVAPGQEGVPQPQDRAGVRVQTLKVVDQPAVESYVGGQESGADAVQGSLHAASIADGGRRLTGTAGGA